MPEDTNTVCTYDPLKAFLEHYANAKAVKTDASTYANLTIEEKLQHRIIDGDKLGLDDDLRTAMEKYSALQIINDILLGGMKVVGDLFGAGEMQLPFVLQSAETMKAAVKFLEPFMDKTEGEQSKGVMVLATVKGDVHDIGKNLVDIILTNNGYRVINLGIKVALEMLLEAAQREHADAIGMSGLLVKSTAIMKENLEVMQARNLQIPVVLGGAALTRKFVEKDLRVLYDGPLSYAQDAFDGLHFMEKLKNPAAAETEQRIEAPISGELSEEAEIEEALDNATGEESKMVMATRVLPWMQKKGSAPLPSPRAAVDVPEPSLSRTSNVKHDNAIPTPPFWGSRVEEEIKIEKVWEYLNEVALFRGQWQMKRGKLSEEAYTKILTEVARPKLNELKLRVKREEILSPKVVYGFFPCWSEGDDLVVLRPKHLDETKLAAKWSAWDTIDDLTEWKRFSFPRQPTARRLCLADFYLPKEVAVERGTTDVVAFTAVTVGKRASQYTAKLFADNEYTDYLFLHGLSVETAEALAEYWHKMIRAELGVAGKDASDITRLFSQGYQGSRFSFGYPACPFLEDQTKLFAILHPERIGVTLTEEFHLEPEQSTTAVVSHHPEAKYFAIK